MQFIDSHIHLDFKSLDSNREHNMSQAIEAGIQHFVVPATTRASWPVIQNLTRSGSKVLGAYGLHPYFLQEHAAEDVDHLQQFLLAHPDAIAVGEIGLDFQLKDLDRELQMTYFRAQLKLAKNMGLPVILHCRKAADTVLEQCRKIGVVGGIAHSYNGSLQQAMQLLELNIKLGFGGAITYPRATRLHELVSTLPLDALCIETDAPDQPVLRLHGKLNQPTALIDVFEKVCALRPEPKQEIAQVLVENTIKALQLEGQLTAAPN